VDVTLGKEGETEKELADVEKEIITADVAGINVKLKDL